MSCFSQKVSLIDIKGRKLIALSDRGEKKQPVSRIRLLKLLKEKDSLVLTKDLEELSGEKDLYKCIKATKSRYISVGQITFCKNIATEYLVPETYTLNLREKICFNKETDIKINNSKANKSIDLNPTLLFRKYHCDCNPNLLSCLDNIYYCGDLYNSELLSKSYSELESLGLIDEMIGKSIESSSAELFENSTSSLMKKPCLLNELSQNLPNKKYQKIFDYSLGLKKNDYRPAPKYATEVDNLLDMSSCKMTESQSSYLSEIVESGALNNKKVNSFEPHDRERFIARMVNNIKKCDNNYVQGIEDRIRRTPMPARDLRRLSRRERRLLVDVKKQKTSQSKTNISLDFYKLSKVELTPLDVHNSCSEDLYQSLGSISPSFKRRWKNYIRNSKSELDRKKKNLSRVTIKVNKAEAELANKNNVKKYIRCRSLKEKLGEIWTTDTSNNSKLKSLNDQKNQCDNYPEAYEENREELQKLLKEQNNFFDDYKQAKDTYFINVNKAEKLLRLDVSELSSNEGISLEAVMGDSEELKKIKLEIDKTLQILPNKEKYTKLKALNSIEENIFIDLQRSKKNRLNNIERELDEVFPPKDVISGITITLGRDPVGGLVRGIAEGLGSSVSGVLNLVKNSVRETSQFTEYHIKKFGRWITTNPGKEIDDAINAIFLKPINWLACGGKQPPEDPEDASEDDDCVEGGIECTSSSEGTDCSLLDPQGNPSDVATSDNRITEEQLAWMRNIDMQDMLNDVDFTNEMRSWMNNTKDAQTLQRMLANKQKELYEKVKNGLPSDADEEALIAEEIKKQKSTIDLIKTGVGAAGENIVQTFKDLIDIAKTKEELEATMNFVAENGLGGLADAMGDALGDYWDEFQAADETGKAEIIGRASSDVLFSLIPVGAVGKFSKETIKGAAIASKLGRSTSLISKASLKLGLKTSSEISDLSKWAGRNIFNLVDNQSGHLGELIGKYKPPPSVPRGIRNLSLEKRKTISSGGGLRKRWKDKKGNIFEWDSQHGRLEKYNKRGKHLGEYDPDSGLQTKPADPTRKVEP